MNLSSHLLTSAEDDSSHPCFKDGGTMFTSECIVRETFGGKEDTVHHEWSHYFTMDNIVHVRRWIGNAEQFILVLLFCAKFV